MESPVGKILSTSTASATVSAFTALIVIIRIVIIIIGVVSTVASLVSIVILVVIVLIAFTTAIVLIYALAIPSVRILAGAMLLESQDFAIIELLSVLHNES